MIFNYETYSSSFKENSLTIGDKLSNKFYGSYPANYGELVTCDWQPSSGSLWLLELNTDIYLANALTIIQSGFDCDAISSFVSNSGYDKLHYVKSAFENFELGDYNPYFLSELSASVVSHGLTYTSSFVSPRTSGSNGLLRSLLTGSADGVLHAGEPGWPGDDDTAWFMGIGEDTSTFYLVNTPLSNADRDTVDAGIFHLSRDKSRFDTFISESGHSNWLPSASSWVSPPTFYSNDASLPDVVIKDPTQDCKAGLTFKGDRTSVDTGSVEYAQQFVVPDVDSNGYPIIMKGMMMIRSGSDVDHWNDTDVYISSSIWLRPLDGLPYWSMNAKYVTSGSDFSFSPSQNPPVFGIGTQVAMSDGSWKNIESVAVGEEVLCGYKTDSIDGLMRVTKTPGVDDQLASGSNEIWRSFSESNLDDMLVISSSVSNICKYKCRKWCTINGHLEVSLVESLLVKDGSDSNYKFKESRNITTSDKLVHSDKSDVDITSVVISSGSVGDGIPSISDLKDFYSFTLTDQDNYFVSQSMAIIAHILIPQDE